MNTNDPTGDTTRRIIDASPNYDLTGETTRYEVGDVLRWRTTGHIMVVINASVDVSGFSHVRCRYTAHTTRVGETGLWTVETLAGDTDKIDSAPTPAVDDHDGDGEPVDISEDDGVHRDTVDPDDPTAMALPVIGDTVVLHDGTTAEVVRRQDPQTWRVRPKSFVSGGTIVVTLAEIAGYPEDDGVHRDPATGPLDADRLRKLTAAHLYACDQGTDPCYETEPKAWENWAEFTDRRSRHLVDEITWLADPNT